MRSKCRLLGNLELPGVDDLAIPVAKLKDVDAPVEVSKVNYCFWGHIVDLQDLFTHKAENLEIEAGIEILLEIKIDDGGGRIGVELNNAGNKAPVRAGGGGRLGLRLSGEQQDTG